jgi:hypothetical protein
MSPAIAPITAPPFSIITNGSIYPFDIGFVKAKTEPADHKLIVFVNFSFLYYNRKKKLLKFFCKSGYATTLIVRAHMKTGKGKIVDTASLSACHYSGRPITCIAVPAAF